MVVVSTGNFHSLDSDSPAEVVVSLRAVREHDIDLEVAAVTGDWQTGQDVLVEMIGARARKDLEKVTVGSRRGSVLNTGDMGRRGPDFLAT